MKLIRWIKEDLWSWLKAAPSKFVNWVKTDLWNWLKAAPGRFLNWVKSVPGRILNDGEFRCKIQMDGSWITPSLLMSGLSFFLLMVTYFGLLNLTECTVAELVVTLSLPCVLMIGYMALLRGLRFPVTPVYGIMGAAQCAVLIAQTAFAGGVWNIILWSLVYAIVGAAGVLASFGRLKQPRLMAVAYLCTALLHFVLVDIRCLSHMQWIAFLMGLSVTCSLLCFGMLGMSVKNVMKYRPE